MARSTGAALPHAPQETELPGTAETLDDVRYNPREDRWNIKTLTQTYHFGFDRLRTKGLSSTLITSLKGVVMTRLRSHSADSCHSFYEDLSGLLRHIEEHYSGATAVTMPHLVSYRNSLKVERYWKSTVTNIWILYWAALGIPGVAEDAVAYAVEAEKHHARKGHAVRTRCPIHGPYTSLEYDGLCKTLHAAFGLGNVELHNYVLCLLSLSLAPRPEQLAQLKACDFKIVPKSDGSKKYVLSVPRIKQRGQAVRTEFRDRELVDDLGRVLEVHVARVCDKATNQGLDPGQVPLFSKANRGQPIRAPMEHNSANNVGMNIASTLQNLGVKSERTGETINSNASRSRRTLGTRLAQEGKPAAVIADILDHSDSATIMVYVEARLEMLSRLDAEMAVYMAPMAQRFLGRVARRGRDAENGVTRHVFGMVQEGAAPEDVGGCGKFSLCRLIRPVACYTCPLFQPWNDGPHQAILDGLLARRKMQAETGSIRVAESLDDTILAVAWVVQQCRTGRTTLEGATND